MESDLRNNAINQETKKIKEKVIKEKKGKKLVWTNVIHSNNT